MFKFSLIVLATALNAGAQSNENSSSLKLEDIRTDRNVVEGNIDDEITNAKMRAESGSRSRWSVSATTDFKGGTVDDAFGVSRPQLVAEPGKQDNTSIDAGASLRYRWSKHDSLTLGTNFGLNTPFQGRVDPAQPQFNVYDPEFGYSRVGRIGRVQTNNKIALAPGTSSQSESVDRIMTYAMENVFLHTFENKVTAGLGVETSYSQYISGAGMNMANREALTERFGDFRNYYGGDSRTQYSLGLFPYAEYAINDRYQLRTVFGWFNYRHLYGDDKSARLLRQSAFQSVGLGVALTRDIYLYPNVQFIPDDVRFARTNVALNAQLNVF